MSAASTLEASTPANDKGQAEYGYWFESSMVDEVI